jgi:hypothetical protein
MDKLITEMVAEAMAYNRHLTRNYLLALPPKRIAAFTHPNYRKDHLEKIRKLQTE